MPAAILFSVACLVWLLHGVDRGALAAGLRGVDLGWLAVAVALAWLVPFWRAARLRRLLPAATAVAPGACWRIVAEALLWAFVLPFKLGELSLPVLLHRRLRIGPAAAAGLFLLVRLADLLVLLGFLALGLAASPLLPERPVLRGLAWGAGAVLAFGPVLLVLVGAALGPALQARLPWLAAALVGVRQARSPGGLIALTLTTWGIWATHLALAAAAVLAASATAGPAAILLASAAGNLAFALPVTGALGLGPQQVAFATALDLGGVGWEMAVLAALATYVAVLVAALTAGVAAWLWGALLPRAPSNAAKR